MRTRLSLSLAALLALVVGLGYWAVHESVEARGDAAVVEPHVAAPADPEREAEVVDPARMPSRVEARTDSTSSADDHELARPLTADIVDVVGEHVITGRVFDSEGRAVSDADVYVVSRYQAADPDAWRKVAATTDDDGIYRIGQRPPGRFSLAAQHSIYGTGYVQDLRVDATDGAEVQAPDIHLEVGRAITGWIVDSDQQPIEDAYVRLRASTGGAIVARSTRTDSLGSFAFHDLQEGEHRLLVDADGFLRKRVDDVPAGTYGLPIELTRPVVVEVQVLREQPRAPVASYRLEVWTADSRSGGLGHKTGATLRVRDDEGRCSIEGLDMGTYIVRVEAASYARAQSSPIHLELGGVAQKVELILKPDATFAGSLTDEHSGLPIQGARLELEHIGSNGLWTEFESGRTGSEGEFEFAHLSAGTYRFHVDHSDYVVPPFMEIVITPGRVTRDIRLTPGATLELYLRSSGGRDHSLELRLLGNGVDRRLGLTQEEGRYSPGPYSFKQLPPGHYRVTAVSYASRHLSGEEREVGSIEIDLEAGEHRLEDLKVDR